MTTQEIIDYYADLLIIQYAGQPKAYAMIQAIVTMIVMDQLPSQVQDAFNLNSDAPAVGVQLDTLGKYAGVVRSGAGFDSNITLNDADFLTLIRIAIITNSFGSSLSEIQSLLNQYFPSQILAFDYRNMRMSYLIDSDLGPQELIQLFVTERLLPVPMGVQLASVVYADIIDQFFGMRTYQLPAYRANPFNAYADYHTAWPWLRYYDAVVSLVGMETESGDTLVQENGDLIYYG